MTEPPPPPPGYDPGQYPQQPPPPGYQGYPQQGYPPQGYPGQYGAPYGGQQLVPRNGMGVAALVLGILAFLFCWTVVGGIVFGVLALIFGIIGRKRANQHEATNGGMALAGAILGGIGLALSIALVAAGAVFFIHHKQDFKNYNDCIDHATSQQEEQQCSDDFRRSITGMRAGDLPHHFFVAPREAQ